MRYAHVLVRVSPLVLVAAVAASCSSTPTTRQDPAPAALPAQAGWPDPLVFFDGSPVRSSEQWFKARRPELKALFAHYMYGSLPPKPTEVQFETLEQAEFLNGQATMKIVRIRTGPPGAPEIGLLLLVPKGVAGPAPTFLAMNFCGNHALIADPRVPIPITWTGSSCAGATNGSATAAGRGAQAKDWPVEEILGRGYALACFYSGDVDSDRGDVSSGVYAWLAGGDPGHNTPANRGTIAAWAWGFQRCVDYLRTDAAVDPQRIAAVGHSRNGKTALLAAAYDERIAIAFAHQAGCGGSAPSRGTVGESVKAINDRFPHWFNANFKEFNERVDALPFDQHCLVALCAPRPVLFTAAEEDQWANPAGQFQVLKGADPVYRFLGYEGLSRMDPPAHGELVDSRLGYYIRPGKHAMTAADWRVFLQFADRHFGMHRP